MTKRDDNAQSIPWQAGLRCTHDTFGEGVVLQVGRSTGGHHRQWVNVDFGAGIGIKRLLPDYVPLTLVGGPPSPTPTVLAGRNGARSASTERKGDNAERRIVLTAASQITASPVRWLWENRIPRGELALLAGRESVGKSTVAYTLTADITRGALPGVHKGTPMTAIVCATEDSWEHTIVPRLHGAGADLARVKRIEVADIDDTPDDLTLPRDLLRLEDTAREQEAALLLLDPLMSRLGKQDTHRDNEVRQALEPLVRIAHETGMSVLGIIHHRKAASTNALDIIMASKAFTAVARSVHTVVYDPDDDARSRRLLGTAKNNLGRADLPILTFTVTEHRMPTPEGDAVTSKLVWGEEVTGSIDDLMQRADEDPDTRSVVADAADWLQGHLANQGGTDDRKSIVVAAHSAGISDSTLTRARKRLRIKVAPFGFPRQTFWTLPGTAVPDQPGSQP